MIKKILLLSCNVILLIFVGVAAHRLVVAEEGFVSAGKPIHFSLSRGRFTAYQFLPASHRPKAVIFFGSGDGGWGPWEDSVAKALQQADFEVIGIDSARYAATPYNLSILQSDFLRMAHQMAASLGPNPPPLIVGGWSMGAGQAIAVAGGPHPPRGLKGLLLASPLSRGRYGLCMADKLNVLPTGPDTFAVRDFEGRMKNLRIVQWHAENDPIDSRAWLADLSAPHREHDFPHAGHSYDGADPQFLQSFVSSVGWILEDFSSSTRTARSAP